MRHLFIVNPTSGSYNRGEEIRAKIEDSMRSLQADYEIVFTEYAQHATQVTQAAGESGEQVRVYACGGDGTLNEVASGAAGYENLAITNVPIGSGNDFLRIFGEDRGRFSQISELFDAQQTAFDLIDCNGRYALNACSVGFDARVGLGMSKYRRRPSITGGQAYKMSLAAELLKGVNHHIDVQVGERVFTGKRVLVCVMNGQYYGGGFHPSLHARPDDGLFDIFVTEKLNLMQVSKLIDRYAKGESEQMPQYITVLRDNHVTIRCPKTELVNLDGERMDASEVEIRLAEKKVNFFYPKGARYF